MRTLGKLIGDAVLLALYCAPFILLALFVSMVITTESVRTIAEEIPLGSVIYDAGEFHVTYIEDGEFRTTSFSTCSVGDRDVLVDAETVKRCWTGKMWSMESDSLTLTNETLARIGAIA